MLTVSVENFGPIREGTVELRPLTVFVGPNNSGKSYMATLVYSLYRTLIPSLSEEYYSPFLPTRRQRDVLTRLFRDERIAKLRQDKQLQRGLAKWYREQPRRRKDSTASVLSLPEAAQSVLDALVDEYFDDQLIALGQELTRCFGTRVRGLTSSFSRSDSFGIRVNSTKSNWTLEFHIADGKLVGHHTGVAIEDVYADYKPTLLRTLLMSRKIEETPLEMLIDDLLAQTYFYFAQSVSQSIYYLPAARSGILQNHRALASALVQGSSRAGLESLSVRELTGAVRDFISYIMNLNPRRGRPRAVQETASFLEREIIAGKISIQGSTKLKYPEIFYRDDTARYALHRTSSMVSEIAPIILFIRHLTRPNDTLILEEPESHLHPASQVQLALGLARLLNGSVNLLLTTHSDYFLQQLSNLIKLGTVPSDRMGRFGYSDKEVIPVSAVGAYLFKEDGNEPGSVIESLKITAADGIPEDTFVHVAEVLYNEMVNLDRQGVVNE